MRLFSLLDIFMKNFITIFFLTLIIAFESIANQNCFIAKENDKILVKEGECSKRYAPQSTFKITLSLIGFDSGILKNENEPLWSLPESVDPYINICKSDHNPHSWMRDSCLWYSNILTSKLGIDKFQAYVSKFEYGNMDLSAGINSSWISSSLEISPEEQINFLQNLINRKFEVSKKSYDMTKNIMFIQEMPAGWKLYAKTGNGRQLDLKGNKTNLQHGWFVGYIEKGNRNIVFATHIVDSKKEDSFASFRARNQSLVRLWHIINDLES
jgi:beta-lactamase class D